MKAFEWGFLVGIWVPWLLYRTVRWADDSATWNTKYASYRAEMEWLASPQNRSVFWNIPVHPGKRPQWSLV